MCIWMGEIRTQKETGVAFVDGEGHCTGNKIKAEIRSQPASYHKVKVRWARGLRSTSRAKTMYRIGFVQI